MLSAIVIQIKNEKQKMQFSLHIFCFFLFFLHKLNFPKNFYLPPHNLSAMTAIKSFADEFIQHAMDKDIQEAKKQMPFIFKIFMQESFENGHYNEIQSILQSLFESKINDTKKYNVSLYLSNCFLTKDIKSSKQMFGKLGMKFQNFTQWFSKQRSTYSKYKKNYIDIDGQRQFRFTSHVWVGSTKSKYDNPNKVLGHKREQAHVRPIFQMILHPSYTIYGGGDCNGENPGNTHGKHGRVLESIFSHIAKQYRTRSYIAGLYYNDVQCNFTSKNDGDINPSMHWIRKNKIIAGCMPITGLFILIRNWSYIKNYEKINEIYYKHFMDIFNKRKCSARQFMSKYKKQLDERVRLPIMKVIEETSIELMDSIWLKTQIPLKMRETKKKLSDDMYHIEARTYGGLKTSNHKRERKKLESKINRINSTYIYQRKNKDIADSDLEISSDDSLSDNEEDTEEEDDDDDSDDEENTAKEEDDDDDSDDDNSEETQDDDISLKHIQTKKRYRHECVVPIKSNSKNGPGRSKVMITLDLNVTFHVPPSKKRKY